MSNRLSKELQRLLMKCNIRVKPDVPVTPQEPHKGIYLYFYIIYVIM